MNFLRVLGKYIFTSYFHNEHILTLATEVYFFRTIYTIHTHTLFTDALYSEESPSLLYSRRILDAEQS